MSQSPLQYVVFTLSETHLYNISLCYKQRDKPNLSETKLKVSFGIDYPYHTPV
jgi:hypothetical protein